MKFLLPGLIAGALTGLLFLQGKNASELIASDYTDLASLTYVEKTKKPKGSFQMPLLKNEAVYLADRSGQISEKIEITSGLAEFSGSGKYYIKYGKVGSEIELWSSSGERYWKMKSREKPLLSHDGEVIFLITGDQSSIRIVDKNGNETGAKRISGRLCTVAEFSFPGNYGACGFADGSYYYTGDSGQIINAGRAPSGNIVKSIVVSSGGNYGTVHYGTTDKDTLRIVNIESGDFEEVSLLSVHNVKTSMHVSNKGEVLFFDMDYLLFADNDGDIISKIKVPEKRPGHSSISMGKGFYSVTYTRTTGDSFFIILNDRGDIFYSKEFPGESFLHCMAEESSILLRGSNSLFSYNFFPPGE